MAQCFADVKLLTTLFVIRGLHKNNCIAVYDLSKVV